MQGAETAAVGIRAIAAAIVLTTLVAGLGFFAASQRIWRHPATVWSDARFQSADGLLALEDLPICSSMRSMGLESDWGQLDPDFAAGKKALAAQDWNGAIGALRLASLRDAQNADIENYMGYAYYRLHQVGPAMQHYQTALTQNRRHRGAHEHLGELYLALGESAKAEQQLAILEDICLIPCEEYGDLERLIDIYKVQLVQNHK